jgi:hypothetical protein
LINGTSVTIPNDMKNKPKLNIVAKFDTNSKPKVESLVFSYRGNPRFRTDEREPFALCGDSGNNGSNGNSIASCSTDVLGCGTHTITATSYSDRGGTGAAGTPMTATFTISGCSSVRRNL